jgi:hypothetical protein
MIDCPDTPHHTLDLAKSLNYVWAVPDAEMDPPVGGVAFEHWRPGLVMPDERSDLPSPPPKSSIT